MTENEYNDVCLKLAEIEGTLDAASFIVSLPRLSEAERERHERLLIRQKEKVRSVIDGIREIQNRDYCGLKLEVQEMADQKAIEFERRDHSLGSVEWKPVTEDDMRRAMSECFEDIERCMGWIYGGGMVTTRTVIFRMKEGK